MVDNLKDEFGLNKGARNRSAQREARIAEVSEQVEPLDPDFPYEVIPVDWGFFNIPAEPADSFDA